MKSVIAHNGSEEGGGFESVAAHSKGFVCGGEGGILSMFEREDKEVYKVSRQIEPILNSDEGWFDWKGGEFPWVIENRERRVARTPERLSS